MLVDSSQFLTRGKSDQRPLADRHRPFPHPGRSIRNAVMMNTPEKGLHLNLHSGPRPVL